MSDLSSRPTGSAALDVVELACLAPSVSNTQPWAWRVSGPTIELHTDPRRLLPATDPRGHDLVVSCGAALHHARVAAAALGWHADVVLAPDTSTLLARIDLVPGDRSSAEPLAGLRALHERRTDRRRFTSWPVPLRRLQELADEARAWGVTATLVWDAVDRFRLELLVGRAHDVQDRDHQRTREQHLWSYHSGRDETPSFTVPADLPHLGPRPDGDPLDDPTADVEGSDGLIVLSTDHDERSDWLRTGQALSALWLAAVEDGLAVVPLSQVVQVDETRAALGQQLLGGSSVGHILVRVGWQTIGRSTLPPVPRRPLDEVLLPARRDDDPGTPAAAAAAAQEQPDEGT